jgi:hypothetical protein
MSKKQDFLRNEQSRDNHPEKEQVGSSSRAADGSAQSASLTDNPSGHGGKVGNEHNKTGNKPPSQTNQSRRTPQSRHDRQTLGPGPQNQVSARKGGGGAGRTPRGAG